MATALLERTAELAALDGQLAAMRESGGGRLVLVAGEAGIGKSALVRSFCDGRSERVLWGGCDPLRTPRPLGPLLDVAHTAGGELAARAGDGVAPAELVAALERELRRRRPSIVVLEDLHWADEATLDVVRLVGRRLAALPALFLVTCRDDELDRAHPVRIALGELRADGARLDLTPLS